MKDITLNDFFEEMLDAQNSFSYDGVLKNKLKEYVGLPLNFYADNPGRGHKWFSCSIKNLKRGINSHNFHEIDFGTLLHLFSQLKSGDRSVNFIDMKKSYDDLDELKRDYLSLKLSGLE